jgi:hypothetical protein
VASRDIQEVVLLSEPAHADDFSEAREAYIRWKETQDRAWSIEFRGVVPRDVFDRVRDNADLLKEIFAGAPEATIKGPKK